MRAKLGFIHHRLWQRDGTYRAAVVLGPAPLLGGACAALLWLGLHALAPALVGAPQSLPWAQPRPSGTLASAGQPHVVMPAQSLPAVQADGGFPGYVPGWLGSIHPAEVSSTLDVNVLPTVLTSFPVPRTSLDMETIVAAGAETGKSLYVGVGDAMLVIRTPGTYDLTLRVARASAQPADCLGRMVVAGRRVVSELDLGLTSAATRQQAPTAFDLQPGLYRVSVALGCWRDGHVVQPGQATVLMRAPGEPALRSALPNEILRSTP